MKKLIKRAHVMRAFNIETENQPEKRLTADDLIEAIRAAGTLDVYPSAAWRRGTDTDTRGWAWTNEKAQSIFEFGAHLVLVVRCWLKRAPTPDTLRRAVEFERARHESEGLPWNRAVAAEAHEKLKEDMLRAQPPSVYDVPVLLERDGQGFPCRMIVLGSKKDAEDAQKRLGRLLRTVIGGGPYTPLPSNLRSHLGRTRPGAYLPMDDLSQRWARWILDAAKDAKWLELVGDEGDETNRAFQITLDGDLQVKLDDGTGAARVRGDSAPNKWFDQRTEDGHADTVDHAVLSIVKPDGTEYTLKVSGEGDIGNVKLPPFLAGRESVDDDGDGANTDAFIVVKGLFELLDIVQATFHAFDATELQTVMGELPQAPLFPIPPRESGWPAARWLDACPVHLLPPPPTDPNQLTLDGATAARAEGALANPDEALANLKDMLAEHGITRMTVTTPAGGEVSIIPEKKRKGGGRLKGEGRIG